MNRRVRKGSCRAILPLGGAFLALWLLVQGALLAQAAGGLELAISPPLLAVMIKPGHSLTQSFIVANRSQRPVYLEARLVPFQPQGLAGGIKLGQQLPANGLNFSLVNANRRLGEPFLLAPGQKQQLVLRLRADPQAQEGDSYYTLLVEQTRRGQFLPANMSQARIAVGANILVTVSRSGRNQARLEIAKLEVSRYFNDWGQPVWLRAVIANRGLNYAPLQGEWQVSGWGGLWRRRLALRPDNVLAQSQRQAVCWQQNSDNAAKLAGQTIPCQVKPWLPGYYQAELRLGGGASQSARLHFWLIPWRELLILALLAGIGYGIKKRAKD